MTITAPMHVTVSTVYTAYLLQLKPTLTSPPVMEIRLQQKQRVGPLKSVRVGVNLQNNESRSFQNNILFPFQSDASATN